jgi:polyhydroxyalkanoate synthesis repressor PhaR
MHRIKKYSNRKLYDTTDKRYITMDEIAELIKAGEEISIYDNQSDQDITAPIVSQLLGRQLGASDNGMPAKVLFQMLRKGGKGLMGPTKKYLGFWQKALTMAEDKSDKLTNFFSDDSDISEDEGNQIEEEILHQSNELENWMNAQIDERVSEILKKKNFATKRQISNLRTKIQELSGRIEALEQLYSKRSAKPKKKSSPGRASKIPKSTKKNRKG